jgi:hypothetical protein
VCVCVWCLRVCVRAHTRTHATHTHTHTHTSKSWWLEGSDERFRGGGLLDDFELHKRVTHHLSAYVSIRQHTSAYDFELHNRVN